MLIKVSLKKKTSQLLYPNDYCSYLSLHCECRRDYRINASIFSINASNMLKNLLGIDKELLFDSQELSQRQQCPISAYMLIKESNRPGLDWLFIEGHDLCNHVDYCVLSHSFFNQWTASTTHTISAQDLHYSSLIISHDRPCLSSCAKSEHVAKEGAPVLLIYLGPTQQTKLLISQM